MLLLCLFFAPILFSNFVFNKKLLKSHWKYYSCSCCCCFCSLFVGAFDLAIITFYRGCHPPSPFLLPNNFIIIISFRIKWESSMSREYGGEAGWQPFFSFLQFNFLGVEIRQMYLLGRKQGFNFFLQFDEGFFSGAFSKSHLLI